MELEALIKDQSKVIESLSNRLEDSDNKNNKLNEVLFRAIHLIQKKMERDEIDNFEEHKKIRKEMLNIYKQ